VAKTATQCLAEMDHPGTPFEPGEGCIVHGSVNLNKVAGHIHIALGASRLVGGNVVHTFSPEKIGLFDTSHSVNSLRFGDKSHPDFSGAAPLDGFVHNVDHSVGQTASMQYFITLIPTLDESGNLLYRFTAVDTYSPIMEPLPAHRKPNYAPPVKRPEIKLPGIYFMYEFSPFVVVRTKVVVPLLTMFTDILGLVGGVIMFSRLADSTLHVMGH